MSRKNKCRGCVWGTRLNEIQQFCPFGSCVMKGGGNNGNDPPSAWITRFNIDKPTDFAYIRYNNVNWL